MSKPIRLTAYSELRRELEQLEHDDAWLSFAYAQMCALALECPETRSKALEIDRGLRTHLNGQMASDAPETASAETSGQMAMTIRAEIPYIW